jgi:hypothetical protein
MSWGGGAAGGRGWGGEPNAEAQPAAAAAAAAVLHPQAGPAVAPRLRATLDAFWLSQANELESITDFKTHNLPLARIKKIMKSDEDVRMISSEAPALFAKACEMFILEARQPPRAPPPPQRASLWRLPGQAGRGEPAGVAAGGETNPTDVAPAHSSRCAPGRLRRRTSDERCSAATSPLLLPPRTCLTFSRCALATPLQRQRLRSRLVVQDCANDGRAGAGGGGAGGAGGAGGGGEGEGGEEEEDEED